MRRPGMHTPDRVGSELRARSFHSRPGMAIPQKETIPQKKKDQLSLAQCGDKLPANRPDPDDPGGLGAEESGIERTGPTQDSLFATHEGGRLAEVGQYYDFLYYPVTADSRSKRVADGPFVCKFRSLGPLAAARGWRDHVDAA